jgi:hypothetical protein
VVVVLQRKGRGLRGGRVWCFRSFEAQRHPSASSEPWNFSAIAGVLLHVILYHVNGNGVEKG